MLMKFIKIEWNDEWRGFWLDPSGYLAELPKLAAEMPDGASKFALQDGHYDFSSPRCVKDLALARISAAPGEESDLKIEFSPNEWKHAAGLTVRYAKVRRLELRATDSTSALHGIGAVQLDEILPLGDGCSHQIAFTGGEIYVECADLQATWANSLVSRTVNLRRKFEWNDEWRGFWLDPSGYLTELPHGIGKVDI
jgi:hypothetical protein